MRVSVSVVWSPAVCGALLWPFRETKAAGCRASNWFSKNTRGKHFAFFCCFIWFWQMQPLTLVLSPDAPGGPLCAASAPSPHFSVLCTPSTHGSSEDGLLATLLLFLPKAPGDSPPHLPTLPLTNDWFQGSKPAFLASGWATPGHNLHSRAPFLVQAEAAFSGFVPDVALG